MMNIALLCLSLLLVGTPTSSKKKGPTPNVMIGYLMDKMCSKRMVGNTDKMMKHTKTCLLEETCASTGFGLMTEKKFIPFDAKGNELALEYLDNSKKERDFLVEVKGSMKKNKLAITELSDPKPQK
ncbi:MAG: hypothetical protein ABI778_09250 [Ignavibacteriota bacterium]